MLTMDDQYRFEDFGLIPLQEHEHPMTPEVVENVLEIPGKIGVWDFGSEIRQRPFTIPIGIIEMDRLELQRKLNAFVAFLYDQYGKPREIKVIFDYEPDKYYTVKTNAMVTPDRLIHAGEFLLPFVANDPRKYSNVFADEVVWGSEVITFQYNYLLGHETTGGTVNVTSPITYTVTVDGLAVKPIFEISGSASSLTISANGYSFSLPSFADSDWVIDCEKYVVTKDGVNTLTDVDLTEFILTPGNNEVSITGSGIDISLRIKYRDRYL